MEKTTKTIFNAVSKFNENATKDEKRLFAMYLIYNIAVDACDNHFETIGLLDSVKAEMHEEFSKDTLNGKFKTSNGIMKN